MNAAIPFALIALLFLSAHAIPNETPSFPSATELQKTLKSAKAGNPEQFKDIFTPLRTSKAALSPDGQWIAYTAQTDKELYVHIVEAARPEVIKTKLLVMEITSPPRAGDFPQFHFPTRWMGWVNSTRLVINTNRIFGNPAQGFWFGEIIAVNADGSDARVLADGRNFDEIASGRSQGVVQIHVVGVDPERADSVIVMPDARAFARRSFLTFRTFFPRSIHSVTGKKTSLPQLTATESSPGMSVLMDHSGRPRITFDETNSRGLFTYLGKNKNARPQSLDAATGLKNFSVSSGNFFGERAVPLGFDPKGDALYYASNAGRDTFAIYAWDIPGKKLLPQILESSSTDFYAPRLGAFGGLSRYLVPGIRQSSDQPTEEMRERWFPSPTLVFDRFAQELAGIRYLSTTRTAVWLRPDLQAVQTLLEKRRPGRTVEILEWDKAVNRFLVLEEGPVDAGAYYLLDLQQGTYREIARRSSEQTPSAIKSATPFVFTLPDGSRIDGVLALPCESRLNKAPLVLLCPDLPWQRRGLDSGQLPELEAFARMGFAAAFFNGRGVWGTGIQERKKLLAGSDKVQAADFVSVANHLAEKFDLDRKRVALFGQGDGGFAALRALQLHPASFRCAVTIDAFIRGFSPELSVSGKNADQLYGALLSTPLRSDAKLFENAGLIKAPVFILASRLREPHFRPNVEFAQAVTATSPQSEFFELPSSYEEQGTAKSLAEQWARIDSFLDYILYDYTVKFGDFDVLPDPPKSK